MSWLAPDSPHWADEIELDVFSSPGRASPHAVANRPLVAVRMLPDSGSSQHWALLQADDLPITPAGAVALRSHTQTDHVEPPGQLPPGEREALQTVFEPQLSWPP